VIAMEIQTPEDEEIVAGQAWLAVQLASIERRIAPHLSRSTA